MATRSRDERSGGTVPPTSTSTSRSTTPGSPATRSAPSIEVTTPGGGVGNHTQAVPPASGGRGAGSPHATTIAAS
ncbi:Uncharacterised protein [Mycobacterium tuberculosis]|nr:Uncharacterised protein [Mycobacterium tuberculosis]